MRSKFSASTRCLAAICEGASRCCSEQPLHCAKWRHFGSTRCGEAVITSTVSASSKCRCRLRSFAITRSPSKAPLTNTVLPSIRATPRPSWPRSVMCASKGVGETELERDMGRRQKGWPPIITDRAGPRPRRAGTARRSSFRRAGGQCPPYAVGITLRRKLFLLPGAGGVLVVPAGVRLLDPCLGEGGADLRLPFRMVVGDGDLAVQRGARSEDTSELQSPIHLVCRLLLEKKNKK